MATTRPPPSRIPVPRSFTAPTTPTLNTFKSSLPPTAFNAKLEKISASERRIAALSARITCSTPTFNQSTKFSHLASAHRLPESPMMQRGQGICNLWRYTDYKTTLAADESSPTGSSSGSLSRKSSRFRLRMRRSKNSLRSSDGSSGFDCHSSRSSSPGSPLISEKALPPLPPLFSPCTSPMDGYYHDSDFAPVPVAAPPPRPRFRARRKPAPEYIPAIVLPTPGSPSSSRSGEISDPEPTSALQNVGPNVFIAYDDDSSVGLTSAFTHVISLVPADVVGSGILRAPRSDITFDPESGTNTLHLRIPPPVAQVLADGFSISDIAPIDDSHHDIQFLSALADLGPQSFKIRRKAVPSYALPSSDSDSSSVSSAEDLSEDISISEDVSEDPGEKLQDPSEPAFSHADLVATQQFLAASGRVVGLRELAYFLSDTPAPSDAPVLGLQPTQLETALAFLRPHPFAPSARRRVLVMVPRGQLALEGLALMACYLATVERCSVRYALRKFEGSVGTVSKPWRGLLGSDGIIASYLEELLLAAK